MADVFPGANPFSEPQAASLVVVGRLRQEVNAAAAGAWLEVWLRQRFPAVRRGAVAARLDSLATLIPLDGPTVTLLALIMSAFGLVLWSRAPTSRT